LTPFGSLGWRENPGVTVATFIFHISLFLVPLFLMGHIALFDVFRGWSWPALPGGLADTLSIAVVIICAYFLWRRVSVPEVRFVTTTQDWVVVILVGLVFFDRRFGLPPDRRQPAGDHAAHPVRRGHVDRHPVHEAPICCSPFSAADTSPRNSGLSDTPRTGSHRRTS